jgi:hypothetical protein
MTGIDFNDIGLGSQYWFGWVSMASAGGIVRSGTLEVVNKLRPLVQGTSFEQDEGP